ncbi:hypothetical protein T265_08038 [Opisthorchis viverrini]|uniref:Uncharacterized protein n=1 Tax=Opisthorchis viverrini TaxID=6198 RepID=A0A074ZAE4_OPIVI|nr:hypothetical protein T265_08038 [Opisthorchis viverrini]KER24246.1 hypothetical protein T265_08038 [Opisthorchis viverrini]
MKIVPYGLAPWKTQLNSMGSSASKSITENKEKNMEFTKRICSKFRVPLVNDMLFHKGECAAPKTSGAEDPIP